MPTTSFHEWLGKRQEEIPDATQLALQIARSGAAGISRDDLGKVLHLSAETLEDLLKGLVAAGQVVVVSIGGRMVYRAAM
jgi:hypothetical protein